MLDENQIDEKSGNDLGYFSVNGGIISVSQLITLPLDVRFFGVMK